MTTRLVVLSVMMAMQSSATSGGGPSFRAEPAPDYESLFRRESGWIGADGDFTVPLGDGRLLWLFSDTFVGRIREGKRVEARMINNSAAVQRLGSPGSVEFFYKTGSEGEPRSLITPDDGRGYFWLFAGAMTTNGLYIFLPQIENTGGTSGFAFRSIGMSLGLVTNPAEAPSAWRVRQSKLPFARYGEKGSVSYGSAVLQERGWVYVYGADSLHAGNGMVLARVSQGSVGDFKAWRFRSGGQWRAEGGEPDILCEGMTSECSVSYVPGLKRYAFVFTEGGMFGRIMMRLAARPKGPWGEPILLYDCPEKAWHKGAFCYAAKAHPELARSPNELIITYAANSMDWSDLTEDARLYWPRFVRVTFGAGGGNMGGNRQ